MADQTSDQLAKAAATPVSITDERSVRVSGLLQTPSAGGARACFVLAHGAGAGMKHPFMVAIAEGLAERGIATLRYQFPYMERGLKRSDPPQLAHAAVRAAVVAAGRAVPHLPLIAGGKSFGGRMTSQAQAIAPLPGVRGLAFFGFPLHPAGKPSSERAEHLFAVHIPMLLLQGSRDQLAAPELIEPLSRSLGERATLQIFAGADHSFHIARNLPARSGRSDADTRGALLDALAAWIAAVITGPSPVQ